jgi:hypothetical protein
MSQGEEMVIMEYSVIKESELGNLIDDVNKAIKQGWKPQGGICSDSNHHGYAQAMIREVK